MYLGSMEERNNEAAHRNRVENNLESVTILRKNYDDMTKQLKELVEMRDKFCQDMTYTMTLKESEYQIFTNSLRIKNDSDIIKQTKQELKKLYRDHGSITVSIYHKEITIKKLRRHLKIRTITNIVCLSCVSVMAVILYNYVNI